MTGRVAVVVVNFGSHDLLATNLAWTAGPTGAGEVDVVIVDNYRSDADARAVAVLAREAGWCLLPVPVNSGYGHAVNLGADEAMRRGADTVVVANPDLRLDADAVARLHDATLAEPDVLVAPTVVDAAGKPWGRLGRVDLRTGRLRVTDTGDGPRWVSGACFAAHRDLWQRLGGMDPDYFMYWEDVDLSVRSAAVGEGVRVLPDVTVVHAVGGTQQTERGKSRLHYFYNTRNRLLFAAKTLPPAARLRWLLHTPADIRRVITRGNPPSRWFRLRVALPPAVLGALAGAGRLVLSFVRPPRSAARYPQAAVPR